MKLFFICFILTVNIYSQSSGIARYKFFIPLVVDDIKTENTKLFVTKMIEFANNQEFELTFSKGKSSFKYIDKLKYDSEYDKKIDNISRIAYTSADSYFDFDTMTKVLVMDDGILIKSDVVPEKWEIKKESKKIGDYLCYKATLQIPYVNKKGENKEREVVCWFAPALPYSFGPKGFNGLPGLILELIEDNKTFLISNFELSEKEIVIDFPKGKTVSKEAYDKKLKEGVGTLIKS